MPSLLDPGGPTDQRPTLARWHIASIGAEAVQSSTRPRLLGQSKVRTGSRTSSQCSRTTDRPDYRHPVFPQQEDPTTHELQRTASLQRSPTHRKDRGMRLCLGNLLGEQLFPRSHNGWPTWSGLLAAIGHNNCAWRSHPIQVGPDTPEHASELSMRGCSTNKVRSLS